LKQNNEEGEEEQKDGDDPNQSKQTSEKKD